MDWIIILVMAGVSFLSHSLVGTVQARGYDLAGARGWGGGCLGGGGRVLRCVPWGGKRGDREGGGRPQMEFPQLQKLAAPSSVTCRC